LSQVLALSGFEGAVWGGFFAAPLGWTPTLLFELTDSMTDSMTVSPVYRFSHNIPAMEVIKSLLTLF
jgi:hypothetical protein